METSVNKNQQTQQKSANQLNILVKYVTKYSKIVQDYGNIKNCIKHENEDNDEYTYQGINIKDKDALVLHLLKQNGDLQNKIIEMASQSTVTNNSNDNSYNTTIVHPT